MFDSKLPNYCWNWESCKAKDFPHQIHFHLNRVLRNLQSAGFALQRLAAPLKQCLDLSDSHSLIRLIFTKWANLVIFNTCSDDDYDQYDVLLDQTPHANSSLLVLQTVSKGWSYEMKPHQISSELDSQPQIWPLRWQRWRCQKCHGFFLWYELRASIGNSSLVAQRWSSAVLLAPPSSSAPRLSAFSCSRQSSIIFILHLPFSYQGFCWAFFLLSFSDPGKPGVRSLGPDVTNSKRLTDVTLADEDTKSILADNVNRAIQGNTVEMQVTQPGG